MFKPENDLETALVIAAQNPDNHQKAKDFYRLLLETDIFVIGEVDDSNKEALAGSRLSIQHAEVGNGETVIPIFSSEKRISEFVSREVKYVGLNGRTLLEMIKDTEVVLNPGSEYGKEFSEREISKILDGSILEYSEGVTVPKGTRVMVGQPAEHPTKLLEALCNFFEGYSQVQAAYLALVFYPDMEEKSHNVIGLEGKGDLSDIIQAVIPITSQFLAEDEYIDFAQVDDSQLSEYMKEETKPFYQRKRSIWSRFRG